MESFTLDGRRNRRHPLLSVKSRYGSPLSPRIALENPRQGQTRIPHKYDHMHDKTFLSDFVQTNLDYEFKYPYLITGKKLAPLDRVARQCAKRRTEKRKIRVVRYLTPIPGKKSPVMRSPRDAAAPTVTTLCIPDGTALDTPNLKFCTVDIARIQAEFVGRGAIHGYIPEIVKSAQGPDGDHCQSLREYGFTHLIEYVSAKLGQTFGTIFLVDGTEIKSLSEIPKGNKVLVFAVSAATFKGVQIES